jgi:hypothetical protein
MRISGNLKRDEEHFQDEETRLLRRMTVQESLHLYASMQKAYEWQIQQSASVFASERRAAMIELQARLNLLIS